MAAKFGKFGSIALFVSCAKQQLIMKARMKNYIVMDVAVAINQCSLRKSTSKAQLLKTVEFSIDFIRGY